MKDLQKEQPKHKLAINRVGITNLELPLKINFDGKINQVPAKVSAFVDLPEEKRGTHMSRLVNILTNMSKETIAFKQIEELLVLIKKELEAEHSYVKMEFTLFRLKQAPVTKKEGYISYKCFIDADKNSELSVKIGAEIFVTSLCPISKSISKYGAHNQRGRIVASVLCKKETFWFDKLISDLEKCGSCELYSLLKREDEQFVTEKAYENPKIVEDIVRELATTLKQNKSIGDIKVSCENEESIHLHNAFSEVIIQDGR